MNTNEQCQQPLDLDMQAGYYHLWASCEVPVYVKPKCRHCQSVQPDGCGYCEDYDQATE